MKKPASKYVMTLLKKTQWKDRKKIEDLIDLEEYIVKGVHSQGGAYKFNSLQSEYAKDYRAIMKELKPKELAQDEKREKRENAKEKRRESKERKLEQQKLRRDKLVWKKLGGKL